MASNSSTNQNSSSPFKQIKDLSSKQINAMLNQLTNEMVARGQAQSKVLPPPSSCPKDGVIYDSVPFEEEDIEWWFFGNHFANLEFADSLHWGGESGKVVRLHFSYPVRMKKSAGYRRSWGFAHPIFGDQTVTGVHKTETPDTAHSFVGVVVKVPHGTADRLKKNDIFSFCKLKSAKEHIDWLPYMETPPHFRTVRICVHNAKPFSPATYKMPILQSHVDLILEGALMHGEDFAAEWCDTIQNWSPYYLNDRQESRRPWVHQPLSTKIDAILAAHPPPRDDDENNNMFVYRCHLDSYNQHVAPLEVVEACKKKFSIRNCPPAISPVVTPARRVKNFLFGFGSIIQTASRVKSDPSTVDAAPCRLKAEFGYVREWNFQASTAKICALGLRKIDKSVEKGASINGVVFPAPADLTSFDNRENGYRRVLVPTCMVEMLSWQSLPANANVYVYVPYAPSVVAKYGKDPTTGLPSCSGPNAPPGLRPDEEAGLGLRPASVSHPILQTYIDVVVTGCLEYGEDFAREFIQTTFLWTPYWLNERQLSRRPWLHEKQYVTIDRLLEEEIASYFQYRKLESEYAVYLYNSVHF